MTLAISRSLTELYQTTIPCCAMVLREIGMSFNHFSIDSIKCELGLELSLDTKELSGPRDCQQMPRSRRPDRQISQREIGF